MGHRQDMTPEQRLKWDVENYKKRLESNRGSNYEYWTLKHDALLENGWDLYEISTTTRKYSTSSEEHAKECVEQLRRDGNYARIVCGYDKNMQKKKMFSIIFKPKKDKFIKIGDGYWNYKSHDIYLAEHPKLIGKYEIFKGCDFIQRCYTLKEAKEIIDSQINSTH